MKPALALVPLLLILAIVDPVVGRTPPDSGPEGLSRTRGFAIDGRAFRVKAPAADGHSLLERELAMRGIEASPGPIDFLSALDSASVEALDEEPGTKAPPALPGGLKAEHTIALETDAGTVEIAFGRVICAEKEIFRSLRSSGWECLESDTPGAIAHITKGGEASFVVLAKDEKRFLAVHRAVR